MTYVDRARPPSSAPIRRLLAGSLFALLTAVVLTMLPGPSAFTPRAAADTAGGGFCFLDTNGQQTCPAPMSWPQPSLLNPAVYDAATPVEAQALRDTEDQALADVLKDHQLPATDLSAVKSFARADAQGEMFSLIVAALKTPEGQRTTTQQGLVDWMSDQATQQRFLPAMNAATEYARFAGKDLIGATQVLYHGSEQQITDFLSGPAEPFSDSAVDAATRVPEATASTTRRGRTRATTTSRPCRPASHPARARSGAHRPPRPSMTSSSGASPPSTTGLGHRWV
jgi:hypothetical protein